jgi:hypothetical protein
MISNKTIHQYLGKKNELEIEIDIGNDKKISKRFKTKFELSKYSKSKMMSAAILQDQMLVVFECEKKEN